MACHSLRAPETSYNIKNVCTFRLLVHRGGSCIGAFTWNATSADESWCVVTEQVTLILKNDLSELEKVMSFVSELCLQNSISPDTEYDLNLALDEMISNVAQHAFPQSEEHHFSVQISLSNKEFLARIEDDGVEFNPMAHPLPDLDAPLEQRKEGGLGIYLVRQIMTSVDYQRIEGKNVVTLRKKLT